MVGVLASDASSHARVLRSRPQRSVLVGLFTSVALLAPVLCLAFGACQRAQPMQLPAPLTLTLPCPRPMLPCPPPVQVCERVLLELNPATAYTFPAFHTRIQEPYNYYAFGQRYIRWVGAGAERSGSAALQLVSMCFTNATAAAGMPAATPCPALPCMPSHPACPAMFPVPAFLPTCLHALPACLPAGGWLTSLTPCWAAPTALPRSTASWRRVRGRGEWGWLHACG